MMKFKFSSPVLILVAIACLSLTAWFGAHSRDDRSRGLAPAVMTDAPPGVRFVTVALGGFRGLLADVLWVRASELQDKGHFFEVAQLTSWITRLEPRYPEVWAYHAWNMAYNITAVIPDPGDRWHWVNNGIRLLRDEGIPSNPGHPKLFWELGWLFYDKVGGRWDEATLFYRISWAREMGSLCAPGLVDYQALDATPELRLRLIGAGLKPDVMKVVDDTYGPLDWRLPETQVIYWGVSGQPFQGKATPWCERLVWMGLVETVKGGGLIFSEDQQIYQQGPRLDVAVKGIRLCVLESRQVEPLVGLVQENFLRESALILYAFGRSVEAVSAMEELTRRTGSPAGAVSLDAYIRDAVATQMKAYDAPSRKVLILRFLAQGEVWRRLNMPLYAEGYEKLARLHWDAWLQLDPDAPAWETLRQETPPGRSESTRSINPRAHGQCNTLWVSGMT